MRHMAGSLLAPLILFILGTAAVGLASPARVVVTWKTDSEVNTLGFVLYRGDSSAGPFSRLNETPILATGDPLTGAEYRYEDRRVAPGKHYFYQLEEIERSGSRRRHADMVEGQAGLGWLWAGAVGGGLALAAAGWAGLRSLRWREAERREA